jgi:hypothetical protein
LTQSENGDANEESLKRTRREGFSRSVRERTKLQGGCQLEGQRGRLEKKAADAEAVGAARNSETQETTQWQVQTQKLNSDLGQMQTYTEQLQAALRDAESSTSSTHNDMEPASPESYKMSLIKQRLPDGMQISFPAWKKRKQLPSSLMRKSEKQLSSR